jgi:hypothetical protein
MGRILNQKLKPSKYGRPLLLLFLKETKAFMKPLQFMVCITEKDGWFNFLDRAASCQD